MKTTCIILTLIIFASCSNAQYEYWEKNPDAPQMLSNDNQQNYTKIKADNDTLAVIMSYKRFYKSLSAIYLEAISKRDTTLCRNVKDWDFLILKNQKNIKDIYFSSKQKLIENLYDSIVTPAKEKYELFKQHEYERLKELVANSIVIESYYLSSPNSAGGVDAYFYYRNLSEKTIKYLTWRGYVLNAVGDMVKCDIREYYYFNGNDTGPIKKGESGGGRWSCAWYNNTARILKITEVSIEYMDGSSIVLSGDLLDSVDKSKRK